MALSSSSNKAPSPIHSLKILPLGIKLIGSLAVATMLVACFFEVYPPAKQYIMSR